MRKVKKCFLAGVLCIGSGALLQPALTPLWAQATTARPAVQKDASAAQPTTAEQYLERGVTAAEKGEYESALSDFNKAAELDPKAVMPYVGRAFTYAQQKQYEKALTEYGSALTIESKEPAIYMNRGTVYYRMERFDEATSDFKKALELDPKNEEAKSDIRLIELSRAIKANPTVATYVARGDFTVTQKDFQTAIDDYSKAIEMDSKNAELFNKRGMAYAGQKKTADALDDYEKAVALNPDLISAYLNRIAINDHEYGEENRARVIADATQVLRLDPKNVTALLARGGSYRWQYKYDEALADYTKVLQIAPDNMEARTQRGIVYFHKGDFERAQLDLEATKKDDFLYADYRGILAASKAIQKNPRDASNYVERARFYAGDENAGISMVRDDQKAIADLTTATKLDPKNARAYALRASIYTKASPPLQSMDKAIADLNQSIKFDKENATVYNQRGNTYLMKGDYDRALADYMAAAKLDPGYAGGSYHRNLYGAEDAWGKAITFYNIEVQRNPKNAEAIFKRGFFTGEWYDKPNQWNDAIADYTRAIALDPKKADYYLLRGVARERRSQDQATNLLTSTNQPGAAVAPKQAEMGNPIDDYSQAIRLDPKSSPAYYYRAEAYAAAKDTDRAIADYSEFIRLRPRQSGHAHFSRAGLYAKKGEWDQVLADTEAYFRLEPPITVQYLTYMDIPGTAHRLRADAYLAKKQWDRAIKEYTDAGNGMTSIDITSYYVGNVYLQKGDNEQAVAAYTRAVDSANSSPFTRAIEARAAAYRKLGKNELAEVDEKRLATLTAK